MGDAAMDGAGAFSRSHVVITTLFEFPESDPTILRPPPSLDEGAGEWGFGNNP